MPDSAELIFNGKKLRLFTALFLTLAVSLASAPGAYAQNKKKKNEPPKVNNDNANPVVPLTDEQQIDYMLSEYLGAWQLGRHRAAAHFLFRGCFSGKRRLGRAGDRMDEFLHFTSSSVRTLQQVRMDRMNTVHQGEWNDSPGRATSGTSRR